MTALRYAQSLYGRVVSDSADPSRRPAALRNGPKPLSGFVGETRRMFARLARVTQKGFQVIAQQVALQCGEVLRSAALQERIDAIKTAVHARPRDFRPFLP